MIRTQSVSSRVPVYLFLITGSLFIFLYTLWGHPTTVEHEDNQLTPTATALRATRKPPQAVEEKQLPGNNPYPYAFAPPEKGYPPISSELPKLAEQLYGMSEQLSKLSVQHYSTELSETESYGFYNVTEDVWKMRTDLLRWQRARQEIDEKIRDNQTLDFWMAGRTLFQRCWEPEWSCSYEKRIGNMGDGGKWLCDPWRIKKNGCLVYSFGSENKFGFEESIYEELGCEIHTFDHTIGDNPSNKPPYVHFHPWGIAATDGTDTFTLETIIKKLGHETRPIEIFKIDVEGYEYSTLTPLLQQGKWPSNPPIRQVLVEIHVRPNHEPPRPRQTAELARTFMRAMADQGYVLFHKEPNTEYAGGDCIELAYLQLNVADMPGYITSPQPSGN
eukprot:GDKI01021797.1.p1 GENE.GDKI01021797.1~~GDKI01021797.1.p1  ORF type:complete len:388 (-),score=54.78 GDKI01021797.1:208-1371(-)